MSNAVIRKTVNGQETAGSLKTSGAGLAAGQAVWGENNE